MYEYCPICDCTDIRIIARHSDYVTFRCEDCGYTFDVDDYYLDYEYDESGYKIEDLFTSKGYHSKRRKLKKVLRKGLELAVILIDFKYSHGRHKILRDMDPMVRYTKQ